MNKPKFCSLCKKEIPFFNGWGPANRPAFHKDCLRKVRNAKDRAKRNSVALKVSY